MREETDFFDLPIFCDRRCANKNCEKHIANTYESCGRFETKDLKDTEFCRGHQRTYYRKKNGGK